MGHKTRLLAVIIERLSELGLDFRTDQKVSQKLVPPPVEKTFAAAPHDGMAFKHYLFPVCCLLHRTMTSLKVTARPARFAALRGLPKTSQKQKEIVKGLSNGEPLLCRQMN